MESRSTSLTLFPVLPTGKICLQVAAHDNNFAYSLVLTVSDTSKTFTGNYAISKENITSFKNDIEGLFNREFNPPEKYFYSFTYDLVCLSDAKQGHNNWETKGVLINSAYLKNKLNLIEELLTMHFFPPSNSNRACLIF